MAEKPSEQSIFLHAVGLASPADRAAYLEDVCRDHPRLRLELDALLAAHDRLGAELPPSGPELPRTIDEPTTERPGTVIGPYKLVEQIGEGGMGTVYIAQQTAPVKRVVAIKLIKPGMDSKAVLARFEAERQALALMDHPNIAKVLDAGTTDSGRPYFVMELVKGVPITKYCDEHRLTPKERLELFVPVCQAIQHAHQKGIIHRDVKPSNILIALYDGRPVSKVIDFGVAKAAGQQLTDKTLMTGFGSVVGTLEYMSPEQAELNQLDIDTRSDIYSLGVVLYELLTGSTPLERKRLKQAAFAEILRVIREEEPPKPSTRLSQSTDSLPSVSAQRHMEPAKLTKLVRGELDWIVMKALEKDRGRRYETANGFAMDVQRYLAGEPVLAAPASQWYRLRKFVRRNRAALWTTGVVAVALVVGTAVSAWQAVRATRAEGLAGARLVAESQARQDADTNFQKARQAVDEYFTVVSGSPLLDAPGLEPLRKQLLETALRYNREFIQQHSEDADLQADVAAAHSGVAEITYLVGGSRDEWFPHTRDAADIVSRLIEEHRDTPEVQQRLAKIHLNIGFADGAVGSVDTRDVLHYLQKQAQNWEKFVRDNPDDAKFQNTLAGIYYYLAGTEGDIRKGMPWTNKAVQIWEKLARENPKVPSYRIDLAKSHEERARILSGAGRGQEADQESQRALRLWQQVARDFPGRASHSAWLAVSYRTLGEMQCARKEFKDAEKTLRSALELQQKLVDEFPSLHTYQDDWATTQQDLGAVLKNLGKSAEAEAAYRHALGGFEQLVVAFPRAARYQTQLLQTAKELAQLLEASRQPQKKKEVLDVVFAVYEKLTAQAARTPEDVKATAVAYQNLANLLRDNGQPKEAEKAYRHALEFFKKLAADFPRVPNYRVELGHTFWQLASILASAGRRDETEKVLRDALALFEALAADFPIEAYYQLEAAHTCWAQLGPLLAGQPDRLRDAEQVYRQGLAAHKKLATGFPKRDPEYHRRLGANYQALMDLLRNNNRPQEAIPIGREAIDFFEKLAAKNPSEINIELELARRYAALGYLLQQDGKSKEAEAAYRHALPLYEKVTDNVPHSEECRWYLGHTYEWLGHLLKDAGRPSDAIEVYRKAGALWERLVGQFNKEDHRGHLGYTHEELGHLLKETGKLDEAAQAYRKALAVWEKLVAELPKLAEYRNHVTQCQFNLAILLAANGRPHEAEKAYRKLLELAPQHAAGHNNLAWLLATYPDVKIRDPKRAVELARRAAELTPKEGNHWNTLGVAYYRAGDWKAAVEALRKSDELLKSNELSFNAFFLAMAHWQLGEKDEARKWYDRAVVWMAKNQPKNEELIRFRVEAEALLGLKEKNK
jgi:serine/threonine protein kinase/Flp pilus assembly protein TadD